MENSKKQNQELTMIDVNSVLNEINVEPGMKIADLGCGHTGHFVFPLAKVVGEKGLVYGVDVQKDALQNIEKRANLENITNVRTVWSNLEILQATKIDDQSLDAILLINILYQVNDKKLLFQEADRMSKSGGKVIVIDWLENVPMGPAAENRIKKTEVESLVAEVGWKKVEDFSPGNYHFGIKFEK